MEFQLVKKTSTMVMLRYRYTIFSCGVKSPQRLLDTYYTFIGHLSNTLRQCKQRRTFWENYFSLLIWQAWARMSLGWQCRSYWPIMSVLPPHKMRRQGEAVYNLYWGHDGIFHLFQVFFFRGFHRGGVITYYSMRVCRVRKFRMVFFVFTGVWLMTSPR